MVFKEGIYKDQASLGSGRFPKRGFFPKGLGTGIEGLFGQLGGLFTVLDPGRHQTPSKKARTQGILLGKNQEAGMRKPTHPAQGRFIPQEFFQLFFQSGNQGRRHAGNFVESWAEHAADGW